MRRRKITDVPELRTPDGSPVGIEQSSVRSPDWLDLAVISHLKSVAKECDRLGTPYPVIVDIGCATGFKAEEFARLGFPVLAIDVGNHGAKIAEANARLATKGLPQIQFISADVRSMAASRVEQITGEQRVGLIHCREMTHFFPDAYDAVLLFRLVKQLGDGKTMLAYSFETNIGTPKAAIDWDSLLQESRPSTLLPAKFTPYHPGQTGELIRDKMGIAIHAEKNHCMNSRQMKIGFMGEVRGQKDGLAIKAIAEIEPPAGARNRIRSPQPLDADRLG